MAGIYFGVGEKAITIIAFEDTPPPSGGGALLQDRRRNADYEFLPTKTKIFKVFKVYLEEYWQRSKSLCFVQSKLSQDTTHSTKVYISRVADNKKHHFQD